MNHVHPSRVTPTSQYHVTGIQPEGEPMNLEFLATLLAEARTAHREYKVAPSHATMERWYVTQFIVEQECRRIIEGKERAK